jgi:predicted ArsR family transcriptional regulator
MIRPHYITPDIEDTLPLFRRTDPATSKAAAASVKTFAGEHHAAILEALSHGPAGASGIATRCGLNGHQVGRRIKELAEQGKIVQTGRVVPSSSGRWQREWQITPISPR